MRAVSPPGRAAPRRRSGQSQRRGRTAATSAAPEQGHRRARQRLAARIGRIEGAALADRAGQAVEIVRADHDRLAQRGRPGRGRRRWCDNGSRGRPARRPSRPAPRRRGSAPAPRPGRRAARQRTVAGEGELAAAARPHRALIDDAADAVRPGRMADPVEDDLGDGALAVLALGGGFVIDRLGEAIERAQPVERGAAAEGGRPARARTGWRAAGLAGSWRPGRRCCGGLRRWRGACRTTAAPRTRRDGDAGRARQRQAEHRPAAGDAAATPSPGSVSFGCFPRPTPCLLPPGMRLRKQADSVKPPGRAPLDFGASH